MIRKHKIFDMWLSGSTCNHHKSKHKILFENVNYIVLKHSGHSEYCGRFIGVKYCETYAILVKKSDDFKDWRDIKFITKWYGRVNKLKIKQECFLAHNILFYDDYESDQWYEYEEPKFECELLSQAKRLTMIDGNIKI